jgi:hypothetical protein
MKLIIFISLLVIIALVVPITSFAYGDCSEYGIYAREDTLTGKCKCLNSYVFSDNALGKPYCVSGDTLCHDKFGYNSRYDSYSGSCECSYGYFFGKDSIGRDQCISCTSKFGYHSTYDSISGTCKCSDGYTLKRNLSGMDQCVSLDSECEDKYGYYSEYDSISDTCKCKYGYMISDGKCVSGVSECVLRSGVSSIYYDSKKSCECLIGYTLDNNNQCVKKQNNVYFTLEELDADNKKAIIKSDYDSNYYLITYNFGCYSSSFERYIGDQIVVNLGTDYNLDAWDKIVLQDDNNETCDIISEEMVGSSATLKEENDVAERIYQPVNEESTKNQSAKKNSNGNKSNIFPILFLVALGGGIGWITWKSIKKNIK